MGTARPHSPHVSGAVGGGGLAQRLGLLGHLAGQGQAGGVVTGGVGAAGCMGGAVAAGPQAVGGQQHAAGSAHGAPGVGAQLPALASEAAAVVVGLVDEVAQVELGGVLGGGQLCAQLAGGVVEDELVVAGYVVCAACARRA